MISNTDLFFVSQQNSSIQCFINGTDLLGVTIGVKCPCNKDTTFLNDYGGNHCSIPGSIWRNASESKYIATDKFIFLDY